MNSIMTAPSNDRTVLTTKSNSQHSLNISGHSCCSCTSRGIGGGFADVSLSNIFADDEERIDLFGETSMVGFNTTVHIEKADASDNKQLRLHNGNFRLPPTQQASLHSMKSSRTNCSASTWQGSCNSFMGGDDELLDLSFTVTDFDNGCDDLSLHATIKNANVDNTTTSTKTESMQKELLRKEKLFSKFNENGTTTGNITIIPGKKRTIQGSKSKSFSVVGKTCLCGGGMQSFDENLGLTSPDTAPRQPVRRRETSTVSERQSSTTINHVMGGVINLIGTPILSNDDESCSSEVIKFNLTPKSRNEHLGSCPLPSGHDTSSELRQHSTTASPHPSPSSSKEDEPPKRPCRGVSPARTVTEEPKKSTAMSSGSTYGGKASTTFVTPGSPKKKVMMIAIKDLGNYISDLPEEEGKSQKVAISPKKYKKIMQAAGAKLLNRCIENERVKISMNDIRHTETSPSLVKLPIPISIAVDCSDLSVSSIDDSTRPLNRDRSTSSSIMSAGKQKSNFKKSVSNRLITNPQCTITSPDMNDEITNVETSSRAKSPRKLSRATSCQEVITTPDSKNKTLLLRTPKNNRRKTSSPVSIGVSKDTVRRATSCRIHAEIREIDDSTGRPPKCRYDSPITLDEYLHVPVCALTCSASKELEFVTTSDRDKPPTSPRRSISPSKRMSSYTNRATI